MVEVSSIFYPPRNAQLVSQEFRTTIEADAEEVRPMLSQHQPDDLRRISILMYRSQTIVLPLDFLGPGHK